MWDPSFMLKSYGWLIGGWVAYSILVSAQGPLVLGFGLRVWGRGLTIVHHFSNLYSCLDSKDCGILTKEIITLHPLKINWNWYWIPELWCSFRCNNDLRNNTDLSPLEAKRSLSNVTNVMCTKNIFNFKVTREYDFIFNQWYLALTLSRGNCQINLNK